MTPPKRPGARLAVVLLACYMATLIGLLAWLGEEFEYWHAVLLFLVYFAAAFFVEEWFFARWWRHVTRSSDGTDDET